MQTRFATSTLALLRSALGENLADAVEDARAVLGQDEADCLAGLVDAEQFTFLGRGWTIGLAEEAVQGAPTDQPKLTVRDWLLLALFFVFVVLFGLPAFLIVVLDSLPPVGDWLTAHVPFWDEVTDFYNWLSE